MPREEYPLHRLRRHTGRQFECACGASFYTPKKLEDHKRELHTGPHYRCGRCLAVFKSWKSFVRHARATSRCPHTNPLYSEPDEHDAAEIEQPRHRPLEIASDIAPEEGGPREHRHPEPPT